MAPSRIKKEIVINLFDFDNQKFEEHSNEVELIELGTMILIPFDELLRLATIYGVPRPQLIQSDSFEDCAYWQSSKRFSVPAGEMYQKLIRYTVMFGARFRGDYYTGEGSAGADNIDKWQIKSYGFEMACKRAKARYYKEVLGLTQCLSDTEVGSSAMNKIEVSETAEEGPVQEDERPDFMKSLNTGTPSTEVQRYAIFNIIKKIKNSNIGDVIMVSDVMEIFGLAGHGGDWWMDFSVANSSILNTDTVHSAIPITRDKVVEVFNFMTQEMAQEFISKMGNFSSTTVKPGKN